MIFSENRCPLSGSCFRFRRLRFGRAARLAPGADPALDMRDRTKSHPMGRLRGERGPPAAGAKEHKALILGKNRLVIGALGIDPEFEHAARAMKGAGHAAFALELANVADIDEGH